MLLFLRPLAMASFSSTLLAYKCLWLQRRKGHNWWADTLTLQTAGNIYFLPITSACVSNQEVQWKQHLDNTKTHLTEQCAGSRERLHYFLLVFPHVQGTFHMLTQGHPALNLFTVVWQYTSKYKKTRKHDLWLQKMKTFPCWSFSFWTYSLFTFIP